MSWRDKLNTVYLYLQKNYERFQPLKLHMTSCLPRISLIKLYLHFHKTSIKSDTLLTSGKKFRMQMLKSSQDFLLIVLAFSTSKNFKLACCLGGFYPQILLNLVKYALFIHIARVPCFFLKYFLVLSRTDYPLKKCSETSQYRTSQIADVLWLADKRFSPKCKNLFKITSQWRTPQ